MSKFSIKEKSGCKRLLTLFIVVILLSSLFAQLISTDFGKVKVENISIDARGALLSGDLYYPAGTSTEDKLPCIIVAHGGAISHTCMRGISEELARRGYVVLNVSAYGAGVSEQPPYDEIGMGKDEYSVMATPAGMLDVLAFARTLEFVDQTRIGMTGHSMGSIRTGACAVADCGYFTLNDLLINILYEHFGQTFTADEIYEDANILAAERLNEDQLKHYEDLKAEAEEYSDTRLHSVMLIGAHGQNVTPNQTVVVGGHEVLRNCQVNLGVVSGTWDDLSNDYCYYAQDYVKNAWYTNGEDAVLESWYALDDQNTSSTIIGDFNDIDILGDAALAEAIANKDARICMVNTETHSKNFFSKATTRDIVRYFEQTLNYNNGNITDASGSAIDASNVVFMRRAAFNLIALFAMIASAFPLVSLLLMSDGYKTCRLEYKPAQAKLGRKGYLLIAALTVVGTYLVKYYARSKGSAFVKKLPHDIFAMATSSGVTVLFVIGIGLFSLVLLIALCCWSKKKNGNYGLASLNIWPGGRTVLKHIGMAFVVLGFGYLALMVIFYLFNQEFRFWQLEFGLMKADYWFLALAYVLLLFPAYFVNGIVINYTVRDDIPEWKDTLITVIINSLGIYLLFLTNLALAAFAFNGKLFSPFTSSHSMLLMVPITVYISRKMYKITRSVWVGAAINALLVCWSLVSAFGIYNYYTGQSLLSIILGL